MIEVSETRPKVGDEFGQIFLTHGCSSNFKMELQYFKPAYAVLKSTLDLIKNILPDEVQFKGSAAVEGSVKVDAGGSFIGEITGGINEDFAFAVEIGASLDLFHYPFHLIDFVLYVRQTCQIDSRLYLAGQAAPEGKRRSTEANSAEAAA